MPKHRLFCEALLELDVPHRDLQAQLTALRDRRREALAGRLEARQPDALERSPAPAASYPWR